LTVSEGSRLAFSVADSNAQWMENRHTASENNVTVPANDTATVTATNAGQHPECVIN